jgi:tetratricopeptide (TPR) repeat protein
MSEITNDPRKQAEFDRLMNLARINRMRGEYKLAGDSVELALEVIPDDPEAREFAADILYATGKWQEAADAYKAIYEQDPSRTTAEEKYAKVLLQLAEGKRQQDLLKDLLENPQSAQHVPDRSPAVAAVLSGIPGFGHVYCGQVVKGVVIMAITALSWLLFFLIRPHITMPEGYTIAQRASALYGQTDPAAIVFMLIAIGMQVYAIVDAAVTADKLNSRKKGIL